MATRQGLNGYGGLERNLPSEAPVAHREVPRPRCRGGVTSSMRARDMGISTAAPTPCRMRSAMRISMFGAAPHNAEAPVKIVTPRA